MSVGLLSNVKSHENDYIDFLSFIYRLSEQEQESIKDIATYLQKIGLFDRVSYYSTDNQWNYFAIKSDTGREYANNIIHIICNSFIDSNFIYKEGQYLEFALEQTIASRYNNREMPYILLKNKELMNIDELKDHVRFLDNTMPTTPTPATNDEITILQAQLDQAHARIAELERQLSQQEQKQHTPRYSHTNEALQALHDVINKFWQDPNNPPKQEFIKVHITNNYPSIDPSKALWIDKIIRHQHQK